MNAAITLVVGIVYAVTQVILVQIIQVLIGLMIVLGIALISSFRIVYGAWFRMDVDRIIKEI